MNLSKGVIWSTVIFLWATVVTIARVPEGLSFPTGMIGALLATLIARSTTLPAPVTLRLAAVERYRPFIVAVTLPMSLVLPFQGGQVAFIAGMSALFITAAIFISYSIPIIQKAGR